MKDRVIGIVGGMGPFTGVDLADKIHQETLAVKDQEHLSILVGSFPGRIPDRGAYIMGQSDENPAEAIADVIRILDRSGVDVAGVPCVTAHCPPIMDVVLDMIHQSGIRLKLLSLLDESVRFIADTLPNVCRVGALSTTASFRQQVFVPALQARGFEVVLQEPMIQDELVNPAIFDPGFGIKKSASPVSATAREYVVRAIRHLGDRGAEAVILGCTELPLAVPDALVDGILIIDPTRALARALIREAAPEKLRPPKEVAG